MAVTQHHHPPESHINSAEQPSIAPSKPTMASATENPISKRQRRPSVRLGEIGDQPAASLTKQGKNPTKVARTRPGSNSDHNQTDDREIGSWKSKGFSKPKRPRTNWVSRIDDLGDGFGTAVRDSETEQSPVNSIQNDRDLNFRVGDEEEDDDRVELDDPSGGQSVRRWGRGGDNEGVRVWLNGLGLGRYWPVFKIHEVDEEVLPLLTLEDLKDMGINAVGSRRKMYCAIQKLSEVFS